MTHGFSCVFTGFATPDSPDFTFCGAQGAQNNTFLSHGRLPGGLQSRLESRLESFLGPRREAPEVTVVVFREFRQRQGANCEVMIKLQCFLILELH